MYKTLLVDSKTTHQSHLIQLLEAQSTPIEIVGQAYDILSAIHLIHQHQPDILFLDTEMPMYSGFKLLEFFENPSFKIIFTTANKGHALRAFRVQASAYLLKPITKKSLNQALSKVMHSLSLQRKAVAQVDWVGKYAFPSNTGWIYLYPQEINYLESNGHSTFIALINGESLESTFSLKECQELLEKTALLRVHRSFMVNLIHLRGYAKGKDSFFTLSNGARIDVGKNFKEDVNQIVSFFVK